MAELMRLKTARILAIAVVACFVASCTSSPPTQSTESAPASTSTSNAGTETSTTTSAPLEPTEPGESAPPTTTAPAWQSIDPGPGNTGALLGVSTGLSRAEREPRWRSLEEAAGRTFDIGHVFHAWDRAIPTEDDLMHIDDGRLLMISWNGTDTREIAAGEHDDWIRSQAMATRDLEVDVLLRWLWEMDGNRRRTWVHSGPDYVAAWNHIRSIFTEVGATNAQFVWCPNEFLFWDGGDPEPWYPGDDAVDWLCADGYNWADSQDSDEWVDLVDIFGDFYVWAEPKGKPIVIGETGSNEAEPGAKAEWFRDVPGTLRDELPEIDAFVYFDKDFRDFGHVDWRVDTSETAFDAWNDISNDPWLNATTP